MKLSIKYSVLLFLLFFIFLLCSCSSGGSDTDGAPPAAATTGTLAIELTDAATNAYNAVYVTIHEVAVCADASVDDDGAWLTVATPDATYNLLELVNGVREQLGITELDAGHYEQLRIVLGTEPDGQSNMLDDAHPFAHYIIDSGNNVHELKVPSGVESGIKLVNGFDIVGGQTTELILDFDALDSIVKAGSSGNWLLKPVIKVIGTTIATITGIVTDFTGENPVEGALVSAQIYDSEVLEDEAQNAVMVQAATITDATGAYRLAVEPGTYAIGAYMDGFVPSYRIVEASANAVYDEDFPLDAALTGSLSGTVTITGGADDQFAHISIRKAFEVNPSETIQVEVVSFNIANGGDYSITLPVGPVIVVASTEEKETEVFDIEIQEGGDAPLDINLD